MKYVCLIYADETAFARLPKADQDKIVTEFQAFRRDMENGGHFIASNRLEASTAATTVRVRSGKLSATDGPFMETKEQLGGFYLIEAKDLNEAIQLAGRTPAARWGAVEVRPVMM